LKYQGLFTAAGIATLVTLAWGPSHNAAQAAAALPLVAPPAVFQAAGPSIASIQSTVDEFRAALGGVNNGNAAGPLATGRREINWDGGGSTATSIVPTPFDGFLNNRGGRFTTAGNGFVQAPAQGLADTFGNPSYATQFAAFSPVRLFAPLGSNFTNAAFFIPGSNGSLEALTSGFGAVFSDIDRPDGTRPGAKFNNRLASTEIRYFDRAGRLIYTSIVPASTGTATFSFLGVVFAEPQIASVRIFSGDAPLEAAKGDAVVMDDFIFGEPQPKP
jgi:hypothetical protein